MKKRTVHQIKCTECGKVQDAELRLEVDATSEPELKDRLLSGEINRLVCSSCGISADIIVPMLYRDEEQRLAIWLQPDDEPTAPPLKNQPDSAQMYSLRRVHSLNELKEKIVLGDSGLDDRTVTLFKLLLRDDPDSELKAGDELFFAAFEGEDSELNAVFAVLREQEEFAFSIPAELLLDFSNKAQEQAEKLFPGEAQWLDVSEREAAKRLANSPL